mgnify:CR=1 FL=1
MSSLFCVWGYVSPESLIPLASALSAIVGGLLLLGNRLQTATGSPCTAGASSMNP